LREYVLVSQSRPRIEVFRRAERGGHWEHEVGAVGGTVSLHGSAIAVDDVYAK
jgi:hypothetical protein